MKKWEVNFVVYSDNNRTERKKFLIEAGNKKLATTRGMLEINKLPNYKDKYKQVVSVEEVI